MEPQGTLEEPEGPQGIPRDARGPQGTPGDPGVAPLGTPHGTPMAPHGPWPPILDVDFQTVGRPVGDTMRRMVPGWDPLGSPHHRSLAGRYRIFLEILMIFL